MDIYLPECYFSFKDVSTDLNPLHIHVNACCGRRECMVLSDCPGLGGNHYYYHLTIEAIVTTLQSPDPDR